MLLRAVRLCAVLLTCGPALLLSLPDAVTFYPEELSMPEGSNASFFCNISTASFSRSDYSLNWYKKINSTHNQKIAELNGNKQQLQKENFVLINHTSTVEIKILNLTKSDSGDYFCGLIIFSSFSKVLESNVSQLTVTGILVSNESSPSGTKDGTEDEVEDNSWTGDFNVPLIVIPSVAGAMLLGLIAYMLSCRMRGQQKPQSENAPLKDDQPPGITVYTVDYGVLEFQQEKLKALVESPTSDHTEYATIVFAEEKPVTPERGKRTKSPSTQAQPC